MNAMRFCFLLGCGLLVAACSGGGSSGLAGVGESCTKTAECRSELVCVDRLCVAEDLTQDSQSEAVLDAGADMAADAAGEAGGEDKADEGFADCFPNCGTPPGLQWISIGQGSFMMGCSAGDENCNADETPAHLTIVSAFEILETEVTEAQYEAVTGKTPSCNLNGAKGPDMPVECITWDDAKAFCEALGGALPTEAQWEYAARGSVSTQYYCGADKACVDAIAWYDVNAGGMKHAVKGKTPNGFGLYDMLGNVWEWTNDWHSTSYYTEETAIDPQGPVTGTGKTKRGGCFNFFGGASGSVRVSVRLYGLPHDATGFVGFRCVR